ncbi:hypothetical protein FALBO_10527 [Fusarium albosuccineum]|uniref:Uncharacterized protein n=1 Tax=Fusarium albosuccineum TaxID=1237068 RepID=A0A8H4L496_9HYPO|nr:hypothetical protein FALBO_10527 [Fusarium albosuccineum]
MLRDRPGTGVTLNAKADEEILKEYLEHYYQELKSTWDSRRYKKVVVSYGNIHKAHDYMSPEWLYMVPALLGDTGNANEMEAHRGTKRAAQYIAQGSPAEDVE